MRVPAFDIGHSALNKAGIFMGERKIASKSISEQIIDEFIAILSKEKSISRQLRDSLKEHLISSNFKKEEITRLIEQAEEYHEDP